MRVTTAVDAGICGLSTTIHASSEDGMFVTFRAESDCEKIANLARALDERGPLNAYEEINPANESVLMATVRECLKGCCAGCAVPVGFFKSMQVAAGLALPKDIRIGMVKDE